MTNHSPLISVVVPMYNSERTIKLCLSSIIHQTFDSMEIIVVDDGSTDTAPDISERMAGSDRRIRVIRQCNSGPVGARRSGVESAVGEWVCFVDSDDTLPPGALEHLYGLIDDKTDIVASTGDEREKSLLCPTVLTPAQYCRSLLNFRLWPVWGRLYRRRLLDNWAMGLSKDFVMAEDFLTNLRILSNLTGLVKITSQKVYIYNRRNLLSLQHRFVPDYDYEIAVVQAAEEAIWRLLNSGCQVNPLEYQTIRDAFVSWRLRYLAGMIGLGYKVKVEEPWVQRLQEDCRETRLKRFTLVERLTLISLRYDTAKIFLRLVKKVKSVVRLIK